MRLQSITVSGHTSIRYAQVELRDINLLVGANGAGKSNFIRVFELLGRIIDGDLQFYVETAGGASALLRQPPSTDVISLEVAARRNRYGADLQATSDDRLVFADEWIEFLGVGYKHPWNQHIGRGHRETALHEHMERQEGRSAAGYVVGLLEGCRVFHFHDTSPDAPVKQRQPTADNAVLQADARNVAAVLMRLRDEDPSSYRRIEGAVRQVAPFFRRFELRPERDHIRLRWRQGDSDTVFSAQQMSDGTLRFVCLATLLLSPDLPELIVLDEPELGLHPYAIGQLAEMLQGAAAEGSQVVVATQSVTLMDQFGLDDLIVVEREKGSSVFSRPDPDELRDWLDDYSLGELWQKNLMGGRPRRESSES